MNICNCLKYHLLPLGRAHNLRLGGAATWLECQLGPGRPIVPPYQRLSMQAE